MAISGSNVHWDYLRSLRSWQASESKYICASDWSCYCHDHFDIWRVLSWDAHTMISETHAHASESGKENWPGWYHHFRCCQCGKFCIPVDHGTYWGGSGALEPPDPIYFCSKCVAKELEHPERIIMWCWWRNPNHVLIAKSILRHRRKIETYG